MSITKSQASAECTTAVKTLIEASEAIAAALRAAYLKSAITSKPYNTTESSNTAELHA